MEMVPLTVMIPIALLMRLVLLWVRKSAMMTAIMMVMETSIVQMQTVLEIHAAIPPIRSWTFQGYDCTDGSNNADNVIDCDDTFCQLFDQAAVSGGATEVDCVNIQDDDGDGLVDCD